ncbi:conserved hypothetical protein [Vibrio aestuarianus]|nr:conserved hypothetical protein [Vibrio aestuarianus]
MSQDIMFNKQAQNLLNYIEKYKAQFHNYLVKDNAIDQLHWEQPSWFFGEKGVSWMKETKNHGFNWDDISNKVKGLSKMDIAPEYQDFMRAYHMHLVSTTDGLLSGSTLDKSLQVMKRWYWEMVTMTGQTHPMFLTADIIHASMDRHKEHSKSPSNVSDYCDTAVKIIKMLRKHDLFLVNIEVSNKHPYRNVTNFTKSRKKAQDADPEKTNDEKLISIRAFMAVIELMVLANNDYQRIFYNMLLLAIICGFRFQEVMLMRMDSLVKREITDKNKREHAIARGWPTYKLGIKYLGAKKAGERIHWLAPTSYPVIEMIYKSVKEMTAPFRDTIIGFRESGFTNFLPAKITELPDEWIECRELKDVLFSGSGGARGDLTKSIEVSMKRYGDHSAKVIPVHRQLKNKYFTKEQLNDYVYQRYVDTKNFYEGHRCVISAKDSGKMVNFNYEDLMFIMPQGAFGIDTNFISLQHIYPLDESQIEAWLGGSESRQSIFDHFELYEDDGSRIRLKKHLPRYNINTFLAIAGVTDHVQAILMGRVDITQNKHYQHQAESQSYLTSSLAVNMLEKAYAENKKALVKEDQLSLFDANGEPTRELKPLVSETRNPIPNEVSRRMAALARSHKPSKNTGVASMKSSATMMVDPALSMEHNLKQNMQTFGETRTEVAHYMAGAMSDQFLPELKSAHDKLVKQNLDEKAKALLERHAKLHPLSFGGCTRDVARWGCPYAMKCQSGLPCGYFTLTGRMGEAEEASRLLAIKHGQVIELRKLNLENPSFSVALAEQEEALLVLEALEVSAIETQSAKKLVSLLSNDKNNPLSRILARINEQKLVGKAPKTLADLFFIEQKRIERKENEETNNG